MERLSYKTLFLIIVLLLIPIVFLLRLRQPGKAVLAEWWNDSWSYRQAINITSHNENEPNVYIITSVNIGSTSKAQPDDGDFRFVDESGNPLQYYISSGSGTTAPTFHIFFEYFPAGAQTIYAYYGNPSAENGFSVTDFSTAAQDYTLGSNSTEEKGGGPVAYWKFNEGVGTSVFDSTVNRNHGIFGTGASAPTWVDDSQCIDGKCLRFDSTDDIVQIPNLSPVAAPYTVSFWFRPTRLNIQQEFIGFKGGNSYPRFVLMSNNRLLAYAGAEKYRYGTKVFTEADLNRWYHVTFTVADSSSLTNWKVYLNGQDITGTPGNNSGSYYEPSSSGSIGGYWSGGSYVPPQGFIDEVKIYPYARSANQVRLDYNSRGSNHGSSVNFGSSSKGPLSDGLVGWWKLDEGTSDTCPGANDSCDSSGNGYDGSWSGAGPTSGKFGIGASFNGGGNYINIGTTKVFATMNAPFSASAWVNLESFTSNNYPVVLRLRSDDTDPWFIILSNQTNFLGVSIGNDNSFAGIKTDTPAASLTGVWHHITVSYNGSGSSNINNYEIYLNGQRQNKAASGTYASHAQASSISHSGSGNRWRGIIDEVRIYNRKLSPDEVQKLYNWAPGPVGHWKMDENVGTSVLDSSGNNQTLTTTSGKTFPSWAVGKLGQGLKFNGVDNSISIVENTTLLPSYDMTVSFWVNLNQLPSEKGDYQLFVGHNGPGSPSYWSWSAWADYNATHLNSIYCQWTGSDDTKYNAYSYTNGIGGTQLTKNTWTHVSCVRKGASLKVYINGVDATVSGTNPGATDTIHPDMGGGAMYVSGQSDNTYRVDGSFDNLKFYNYARSASQIVEDMNSGRPASSSPIGWWKLDEGYGTTATNSGISGTSLNGVFASGSSSPVWTTEGNFGKALNFDGNDYVTLAPIPNSNSFTASVWLNPTNASDNSIFYANTNGNDGWAIAMDRGYGDCGDGDICVWLYGKSGTGGYIDFPYDLPTNTWTHFAATFSETTGLASIYINGQLKHSETTTWAPVTSAAQYSYISKGDPGWSPADMFFIGKIDDLQVYNYDLPPDGIKALYNRSSVAQFGQTNQAIGATTTSLVYCIPGDISPCLPPVAHWKFEEAIGTTANDSSGNNNYGVFGAGNSSPTWTNGKNSKAVNFNGQYNTISLGANKFDSISEATIEGEFYYTGTFDTNRAIFNHYKDATHRQPLFIGYPGGYGNKLVFESYIGTNKGITSNDVISPNTWYHFAITCGSGGLTMYLNGIKQTSTNASTECLSAVAGSTVNSIGGDSTFQRFQGILDNLKIYDYARTPAQIAYDYNRGAPVVWWKFDECQGSTVNNAASVGNTGLITIGASGSQNSLGTCSVGTSAAWTAGSGGKFNSSLSFDGTDDYVFTNDSPVLSGLKHLTVSAWIYQNTQTGSWDEIVNDFGTGSGDAKWWLAVTNSGSKIEFGIQPLSCAWTYDTPGKLSAPNNSISTGRWHHVVGTYDGATEKIYIDGKEVASQSYTTGMNSCGGIVQVGTLDTDPNDDFFDGKIDDVRIYSYALTSSQIKNIYNGSAVNFR